MGQEIPQTLETISLAHFFERTADGRKHSAKNEGLEILKNVHFCEVHISLYKNHFKKSVSQKHAFLVHPLGVSKDFLHTTTFMFSDPRKERHQQCTHLVGTAMNS